MQTQNSFGNRKKIEKLADNFKFTGFILADSFKIIEIPSCRQFQLFLGSLFTPAPMSIEPPSRNISDKPTLDVPETLTQATQKKVLVQVLCRIKSQAILFVAFKLCRLHTVFLFLLRLKNESAVPLKSYRLFIEGNYYEIYF